MALPVPQHLLHSLKSFERAFSIVNKKSGQSDTRAVFTVFPALTFYLVVAQQRSSLLLLFLLVIVPLIYRFYELGLAILARRFISPIKEFSGYLYCERQDDRIRVEDLKIVVAVYNALIVFTPVTFLLSNGLTASSAAGLFSLFCFLAVPLGAVFFYNRQNRASALAIVNFRMALLVTVMFSVPYFLPNSVLLGIVCIGAVVWGRNNFGNKAAQLLIGVSIAALVCYEIGGRGLLFDLHLLLLLVLLGMPLLWERCPIWAKPLYAYRNFYLWISKCDLLEADDYYDELKVSDGVKCKKTIADDMRNAVAVLQAAAKIEIGEKFSSLGMAVGYDKDELKNYEGSVRIKKNDDVVYDRPIKALFAEWNEIEIPAARETEAGATTILTLEVPRSARGVYFEAPYIKRRKSFGKTIILIIVDALAKNNLRLYNPAGIETPSLEEYFKDSSIYHNSFSQGEWTTSNFWTMLTSYYSSHHRCTHRYEALKNDVPKSMPALAEIFQQNGFYTFFYSCNRRAAQAGRYDRGFQRLISDTYMTAMNADVTYKAIDVLNAHKSEDKFIVLHYVDVHGPPLFWSSMRDCNIPLLKQRTRDVVRSTPMEFEQIYCNQIRELDLGLGMLFGYLKQDGYRDHTAVVFTADHGQSHLIGDEDKIGQLDANLSVRMTNIPLLVRAPWCHAMQKRQFSGLIEGGVDLFPSLLELAGIEAPSSPYAESFIASTRQKEPGKEYVITESIYEGVVQRVIRKKEFIFYRKFAWNEVTTENDVERIWKLHGTGMVELSGGDFEKRIVEFREKEKSLKLVLRGDNPMEYYGEYISSP